ncbi:hypothetical protein KPL71_011775 [Citrus sinensis]|uniref:Uncharacterized protein n=1 Tax=Citrus sinensis TaxID=2711 RepID=A0ACB8L6D8_CITSI|nr:hypothetical protein KPL71_011775 [Citrus sinensis]
MGKERRKSKIQPKTKMVTRIKDLDSGCSLMMMMMEGIIKMRAMNPRTRALLPGPSQATPMQNLDLSRTPPQIHASQNPLIPALVPTSLNPQHHSAISFVHYPIGKPPDLGSVKMNDNMAEDSDDSDYLGTSEEEGSGTSDADTSVVNEREMELELEALRSPPNLIKTFNPAMVVVLEPQINGRKADACIKNNGFECSHRVEAEGFSGGIWILWNNGPIPAVRKQLWHHLGEIANRTQEPWLVEGDFNTILYAFEKKGGANKKSGVCSLFKNWFQSHNLCDIEFKGPRFTWSRGNLYKRLDRYTEKMVLHLPEVDSDHRPVLVKFSETDVVSKANKPFWFLSVWPTNENFGNFVASNWNSNTDYVEMRKRRLLARLGGIQQALEVKPTRGLEHLEKKLKKELESLTQEEMYWQQKSRKDWILLGDRNTNFFHQKTLARRRKNHIIAIMDESSSWLYDTEAIKWHAIVFFLLYIIMITLVLFLIHTEDIFQALKNLQGNILCYLSRMMRSSTSYLV